MEWWCHNHLDRPLICLSKTLQKSSSHWKFKKDSCSSLSDFLSQVIFSLSLEVENPGEDPGNQEFLKVFSLVLLSNLSLFFHQFILTSKGKEERSFTTTVRNYYYSKSRRHPSSHFPSVSFKRWSESCWFSNERVFLIFSFRHHRCKQHVLLIWFVISARSIPRCMRENLRWDQEPKIMTIIVSRNDDQELKKGRCRL
jgi:hypothetical protein